jgi:hypothetical protein
MIDPMTKLASFADELQKMAAPQGLMRAIRERGLSRVLEEYGKHSALNAGQAMRDLRYLHDYPGAAGIASSIKKRLSSLANNVKYTIKSPHSHHEAKDLVHMDKGRLRDWFLHGYAPWKHPDPIVKKASYDIYKPYREGPSSTFTHNQKRYGLDDAIEAAENKPVVQVPVKDLVWIFKYSRPSANRTRQADPRVPVLVTKWGDRDVVIDGLHRLSRAQEIGLDTIPVRRLSEEDLTRFPTPAVPDRRRR